MVRLRSGKTLGVQPIKASNVPKNAPTFWIEVPDKDTSDFIPSVSVTLLSHLVTIVSPLRVCHTLVTLVTLSSHLYQSLSHFVTEKQES